MQFRATSEPREGIRAGAGGILYGKFLAAVISFLVIAFVIFLMVKAINSMKKKEEPAPAAPAGPTQEQLLAEIRDLLKK